MYLHLQVGAPGPGQWVKEALGKDEKAEAAARKVLNYHQISLSLWVKLTRTCEHETGTQILMNRDQLGTLGNPNMDPNWPFMKLTFFA